MIVRVTGAGAAVEDIGNLRELRVDLDGADDATARTALADAGLGELTDEHAWLGIDALRAAGNGDEEWLAGFADMIRFAQREGWVSGDRVRAHVVRSD